MDARLLRRVLAGMRRSRLVRAADSVRRDGGAAFALGRSEPRPLTSDEVAALERLGNTADDWGRVLVADGFDCSRLRNNDFHGTVLLGRFNGAAVLDGVHLATGVYHSTLADCVVGHDALIRHVRLLARAVVGPTAVVADCGAVSCAGPTAFGTGQPLAVGPETGGREFPVYAEIPLDVAAALTRASVRREVLGRYGRLVAAYMNRARSDRSIIERGAVVRGTARVHNVYLGPHAIVDNAAEVRDCAVLSGSNEPAAVRSGASVSECVLQWGARAETGALVERSVLTEHSGAERYARVNATLLGPNTVVAGGEVTASLVGPFVGFHHQALLIAAVWPDGRGNVSQGANVGANHTCRAPDQEARLGEGTFLGLGANVKYPVDLSRAPFCTVACGVNLPPQRVDFPFALIAPSSSRQPGGPPAANEIVPAWALTDNLYGLRRTEWKHGARNRARRTPVPVAIFRPQTIDLMRAAADRLAAVAQIRDVYTDRQVAGLGKNYLTEEHRARAVAAYRFHIRLYALLGLYHRARTAAPAGEPIDGLLHAANGRGRWSHQRELLVGELRVASAADGLAELCDMLDQVADDVERSKYRDDVRGRSVLDDYADVHPPAAADPVVGRARDLSRRVRKQVGLLVQGMPAGREPRPRSSLRPARRENNGHRRAAAASR